MRDVQQPSSSHFLCEPLLGQAIRQKAIRGESLAPKKNPGAAPKLDEKARKLLEDDQERPYLTLQDRCEYIEVMTGLSVSRSTMCRAIARIGSTRKKGDKLPQNATSLRGQPGR
jgi:transposase